ncbi:MAG: hypothetical protein M0P77_03690 [Firmicutes bacterium]|nr:hypothetical protein [Bacillota bacterium]
MTIGLGKHVGVLNAHISAYVLTVTANVSAMDKKFFYMNACYLDWRCFYGRIKITKKAEGLIMRISF